MLKTEKIEPFYTRISEKWETFYWKVSLEGLPPGEYKILMSYTTTDEVKDIIQSITYPTSDERL